MLLLLLGWSLLNQMRNSHLLVYQLMILFDIVMEFLMNLFGLFEMIKLAHHNLLNSEKERMDYLFLRVSLQMRFLEHFQEMKCQIQLLQFPRKNYQ